MKTYVIHYCSYTATVVTRTLLNTTLYVHCLSCLTLCDEDTNVTGWIRPVCKRETKERLGHLRSA